MIPGSALRADPASPGHPATAAQAEAAAGECPADVDWSRRRGSHGEPPAAADGRPQPTAGTAHQGRTTREGEELWGLRRCIQGTANTFHLAS